MSGHTIDPVKVSRWNLPKAGLSAIYLLMLAGDISTNPGPGWNTNLQNSANLVDDVLNGEPILAI